MLLDVKKGCTVEELKSSFKRISKKVHPDKGGDAHLFKLLSDAFRQVMSDIQARESDTPHAELKSRYQRDNDANVGGSSSSSGGVPTIFEGKNQREVMKKFNAFFERNKLNNPEDEGYGSQMAVSSKTRDDISASQLYKGPYNQDRFNSTFNQQVPSPKVHQLAVYEEPASAFSISALSTSDLTGRRPENFSGENGNLQFEDYMKAHSTSRLVDATIPTGRRTYKSMDEIKASRSSVPTFTQDEMAAYLTNVEQHKRFSEDEARAVRERDALLERHHMMVNRMLTSRR